MSRPPIPLPAGWRVVALDDERSTRRLLSITLSERGGCDAVVVESGFMSLSEYSRSRNEARATVLLIGE